MSKEMAQKKLSIEQIIENEMKPRDFRHWGHDYKNFSPVLASKQHGDGQRLMWFAPLNTRPNYYLIRVDSQLPTSTDGVEDEDEFYNFKEDVLIPALEDEFGSCWDGEDEDGKPWPALDLSAGCSWGFLDEYGDEV